MTTINGPGGVAADTRKFGPRQFVFRPGGTAVGNVYTDFALLYAALNAAVGRKILLLDNSIANITIPAGTYNLTNTVLKGLWKPDALLIFLPGILGTTPVTIPTGVVIQDVAGIENIDISMSAAVSTPFTFSGTNKLYIRNSYFTTAPAANPIFSKTGSVVINLYRTRFTGSTPVWALGSSSSLQLLMDDWSEVDDDVFAGTGTASVSMDYTSGCRASVTQTGVAGSVSAERRDLAVGVELDPTGMNVVTATEVQGAIGELDTGLDLVSTNLGVAQSNVIYVSKVGNDSNSGLRPGLAKATLISAITAATALTPTAVNRVTVVVLDAGTYASGAVVLPDYVSLHAPSATVVAGIALGNESRLSVHRVEGGQPVSAGGATGECWIEADSIQVSGTCIQLVSTGPAHIKVGRITVSGGAATGVSVGGSAVVTGTVGLIEVNHATAFGVRKGTSSEMSLQIDRMTGIGTGIQTQVGTTDIMVGSLLTTAAYDLGGATILNVLAVRVTGTTSGSGILNEVKVI